MLKKVLLAFLVAVAVVLGAIAVQPSTYTVNRSVVIAAPPAVIFNAVNDFHRWPAWSPWEKLDPAMKKTYTGSQEGAGAVYHWSGNNEAGEGSMTMTQSVPNDHVTIQLAFTRPFSSSSVIGLAIKPEGAGSLVTWNLTGQSTFPIKAISLFSSMDKMMGPDFERGLAQLKTVAEAAAQK